MDALLPNLMRGVPEAVTLWLMLILSAVVAVGLVMLSQWRLRERVLKWWVRRAAAELRTRNEVTRAVARKERAAEMASLVELADAIVENRRGAWEAARDAAEVAWQLVEDNTPVLERDRAATAIAVPRPRSGKRAVAERREWLHRAALRSLGRGHLSHPQLLAIRAGRHAFDPRRHAADLEIQLHRAVRRHLFDAYRDAAAAERTAWE